MRISLNSKNICTPKIKVDDPLLAPQTGSEEDAGSYGNLVPLQDLEEEIREKNPEIF